MRGGEGSRAHGAPRCFPQQATCQVTPVQLQLWAQMPGCGAALREARGGRTKGGSSAGHAKSSPGHFCATSGGLFGTGVGRTPGELTAPTNPLDSTRRQAEGPAQTGRGTESALPRGRTRLLLSRVRTAHRPLLPSPVRGLGRCPRRRGERPKKGEKEGKETRGERGRGARPEAARPQSGAHRRPADPVLNCHFFKVEMLCFIFLNAILS